jgi:hypothetical protein
MVGACGWTTMATAGRAGVRAESSEAGHGERVCRKAGHGGGGMYWSRGKHGEEEEMM